MTLAIQCLACLDDSERYQAEKARLKSGGFGAPA